MSLKYIILLLICTLGACQKKAVPSLSSNGKYLALGDSYTIGESVDESQRWPVVLAQKLKTEGFDLGQPEIIARTGWTTDELNAGINQAKPNKNYRLVSLLIGVNNQYRGRSASEFAGEFKNLLERAVVFASGERDHVFVVSIPDYGVTPFAKGRNPEKIGQEIDEYNAVQKRICEEMGIDFYNITPISREAEKKESLVASDGLHPSAEMYNQWVDFIFEDVKKKLQ